MRARWLVAYFSLGLGFAHAATIRVGDNAQDNNCDFDNIQEAIDASTASFPNVDTIEIANTGTYLNQAITIGGNKSIALVGDIGTCELGQPDDLADIAGNAVAPVFTISPAAGTFAYVTMDGLHIHGGGKPGTPGSNGGGIAIVGYAQLAISNSNIVQNNAQFGAGIYASNVRSAYPEVILGANTGIGYNNATTYGGGIFINAGYLYVQSDDVEIEHNVAGGAGGGIADFGAYMEAGNPAGLAARYDAHGAIISFNTAGTFGGGVYLDGTQSKLYGYELAVDHNIAGLAGGGIFASDSAFVSMARDFGGNEPMQCPNQKLCSSLSGNSANAGHPGTLGGGIALYSNARATIAQTFINNNTSERGSIAYLDAGANLAIEGVVATNNQSFEQSNSHASAPIETGGSAAATLRIAYTTFNVNYEYATASGNTLTEDIIAQPGTVMSIYSTAAYDSPYFVVAYSDYTLDCTIQPYGSGSDPHATNTRLMRADTPGFVNESAGDFRLYSSSALTDFCDTSAYQPLYRDIVLTPRCHDDPNKPNTYGACDVGANESDDIFGNGFE
jgi:hypothetical protein